MTKEEILMHLLTIAFDEGVTDSIYHVSCDYCSHRDDDGYCPIELGDECVQTTDEAIALLIEHWQEV